MFTPYETTLGALLLHLATYNLLFDAGAILGCSGLLRQLIREPRKTLLGSPKAWFFGGVIAAVAVAKIALPEVTPVYPAFDVGDARHVVSVAASAALTAWGTKHCGGCTSGHMLCGLGRLSPRSMLATAIFFPTAVATFQLVNPGLETAGCVGAGVPCYRAVYPSWVGALKMAGVLVGVYGLFAWMRSGQASEKQKENTRDRRKFEAEHAPSPLASSPLNWIHALTGLTFTLGLLTSGMSTPSKVQSFFAINVHPFDITHWDPSLSLIILFGVLPNIIRTLRRGFTKPPTFATRFSLPTKTMRDVDTKFVLGAIAFGVSWGWTGVCPGPAMIRSLLQPVWGLVWIGGFYVGSVVP